MLVRWYIPLIVLAAVAAWLMRVRNESPYEVARDASAAVDERARVKRLAIERDAEVANAVITSEYFDTIRRMDEQQTRKSDALRRNPVRRVRYLRRLSRRLRNRQQFGASDYEPNGR